MNLSVERLNVLRHGGATRRWRVAAEQIGVLNARDGWLSAGDPTLDLANTSLPPRLSQQIPPGTHPLSLSLAEGRGSRDRRIAAAVLAFADEEASVWENVPLSYEDSEATILSSVAVDSAHAFLGEYEAACSIARAPDPISDLVTRSRRDDTFDWGEVVSRGGGNVFVFSSGMGDGNYPLILGFSQTGDCVCLVFDFLLL